MSRLSVCLKPSPASSFSIFFLATLFAFALFAPSSPPAPVAEADYSQNSSLVLLHFCYCAYPTLPHHFTTPTISDSSWCCKTSPRFFLETPYRIKTCTNPQQRARIIHRSEAAMPQLRSHASRTIVSCNVPTPRPARIDWICRALACLNTQIRL